MRWGVLFGALVIVAGCSGKSHSDDDASDGNDAGTGGTSGRGGTGGSLGGGATGGTTGGSGGSGGTGGSGGIVDQHCSDLSPDAPRATMDYAGDEAPPTPQGGVIASGTYYLEHQLVYGQAAECVDVTANYNALGVSLVEIARFEATSASGGTVEIVSKASAQGQTSQNTGAGTYTTAGTLISVVPTCGNTSGSSAMVEASPYTVSGADIILFDDGQATCSPVIAVFHRL